MKTGLLLMILFVGSSSHIPWIDEVANHAAEKPPKVPKDFIMVGDKLLVGLTEVTLGQWHEFLTAMRGDSSLRPTPNPFNECLDNLDKDPDFAYRDTTFISVALKRQKTRHFRVLCKDLPVTGITMEQAQAYCKWLTERFRKDPALPDYTFRLPTDKEYYTFMKRTMLVAGKQFRGHFHKGKDDEGCAFYNYKHDFRCKSDLEMKLMYGGVAPRPVFNSIPSSDGLWELYGNVAELTQTKGVAKGGAYNLPVSQCRPESVNRYEGPQPWIGFRVIANVKK